MAALPVTDRAAAPRFGDGGLVFDSIAFVRAGRQILNGIFLRIAPGEICGLYGLTGSGRSTLLEIGAGQLRPDGGLIFVDGVPYLSTIVGKRFNDIAYLSQTSFLPADLTVRAVMAAFPIDRGSVERDEILQRCAGRRVGTLARGELRYLEVRLILALDRKYILLDEPFTGMEPLLIERIAKLIAEQAGRGKGILLTDQYYKHVLQLAHDSYLLCDGRCRRLRAEQNISRQLHTGGYL